MKKLALVLLFVLAMSSSSYALNVIDAMTCKKVVIVLHHKMRQTVLVNKTTGEVKYLLVNKKWVLLEGYQKDAYQGYYNVQFKSQKR